MIDNLNYVISRDAFYWGLFIFVLVVSVLIYGVDKGNKKLSRIKSNQAVSGFILIITIIFLTFCVGADKQAYKGFFEDTCMFGILHKDYFGWEVLEYVVSLFTHSATVFFFIVASVYAYLNFWFCKQNTKNYLPLFIAVLSFMGFYAYGVNTIKSGLSLAIGLYSFAIYEKDRKAAWLVVILAILIHHSIIIPLLAFEVSHRLKSIKYYYAIWVVCLLLSLAFGNFFQLYLGGVLGEDADFSSYLLTTDTDRYSLGFRYDFLFYSMVPIIWTRIFLKDYHNDRWALYYKTYLLVNAFWLLVISMPFTDRVAYLSWFLIPYILFIPILDDQVRVKHSMVQFVFAYLIFAGYNIVSLFSK